MFLSASSRDCCPKKIILPDPQPMPAGDRLIRRERLGQLLSFYGRAAAWTDSAARLASDR